MKISRSLSFCLIIITLSSFVLRAQNKIEFTVKGWENRNVMLAYYLGDKQFIVNSPSGSDPSEAEITLDANGYGVITSDDLETGNYLLVLRPENQYYEFIYEGKDMMVNIDLNTNSIEVPGSASNALMTQINDLSRRLQQVTERKASDPGFDDEAAKKALYQERIELLERLDREDPDNLGLKMLRLLDYPAIPAEVSGDQRFYYSRERFLDHIDFSEDWLLRTPLFTKKINEYFERMTVQHPDSLIVSIDKVLTLAEPNREVFQYILIDQLNKYSSSQLMGYDAVWAHLVNTYYRTGRADWVDEVSLTEILSNADRIAGTLIGDTASNFSYTTTEGSKGSVADLNSEFTILFFMDPHCENCITSAKNLIELRSNIPEYVNIIGVAMNTNLEEMVRLKEERGYFWTIGLLENEDRELQVQEDYDVRNFPKTYVLDRDKKIVAKSLGFEQIFDYITRIR